MNIQTFGGRRFLLTVGCSLINTLLLWHDKLDTGSYTAIILGTVGAYITANTVQKVKGNAAD